MNAVINPDPVQSDSALPESLPYAPSWFDRLEGWVEKLPGHYLIYYTAFGILVGGLSVLGVGGDRTLDGLFSPINRLFGAFLITYLLGVTHFLDRAADAAAGKIKPSLNVDKASFQLIKYRLTNLPAGMAIGSSLAWLLLLVLSVIFYPNLVGYEIDLRDPTYQLFFIQGIIVWWLLGLGSYHTIHQLREVSRTHERFLQVNLYNLGDLYSLSSMTAISSIGVILPVAIGAILLPEFILQPMGLAFIVASSLVAGLTLAWPIWNVHQAMVKEKARLQAEGSARYEALLEAWHAKIDTFQLEGSSQLDNAVQALRAEKDEIKKIPTWPWSPGVLRGWIASLLLPLAIWAVQVLLENFVL